jgi:hypothetical protein
MLPFNCSGYRRAKAAPNIRRAPQRCLNRAPIARPSLVGYFQYYGLGLHSLFAGPGAPQAPTRGAPTARPASPGARAGAISWRVPSSWHARVGYCRPLPCAFHPHVQRQCATCRPTLPDPSVAHKPSACSAFSGFLFRPPGPTARNRPVSPLRRNDVHRHWSPAADGIASGLGS